MKRMQWFLFVISLFWVACQPAKNSQQVSMDGTWIAPYTREHDTLEWTGNDVFWRKTVLNYPAPPFRSEWKVVVSDTRAAEGRYILEQKDRPSRFLVLDYVKKDANKMLLTIPRDTFTSLDLAQAAPFSNGVNGRYFFNAEYYNSLPPKTSISKEELITILDYVIATLPKEPYMSKFPKTTGRKKVLDELIFDYLMQQNYRPIEYFNLFEDQALASAQEPGIAERREQVMDFLKQFVNQPLPQTGRQ